MKNPSIAEARRVCEKLGARGVVIVAIGHRDLGNAVIGAYCIAGASYGETKRECAQMRVLLDRYIDNVGPLRALDGCLPACCGKAPTAVLGVCECRGSDARRIAELEEVQP